MVKFINYQHKRRQLEMMGRRSFNPTLFTVLIIILFLQLLCLVSGKNNNNIDGDQEENNWSMTSYDVEEETCARADDYCTIDVKDCCNGSACICDTIDKKCRCQKQEVLLPKVDDTAILYGSVHLYPNNKRASEIKMYRRSCVRRGGSCDDRPTDCCQSGSCRCNLWGSNCRCQRAGLFQKWG